MTAIVEQDPVIVDLLRSTLGVTATVLVSPEAVDAHLATHPGEDVLVLGPSVDDDAAARIAGHNRIARPHLGVVLVRPSVDNAVLADAMRSGVREVVETPDATGLREAVSRVRAVAAAMLGAAVAEVSASPRGAVVTVFSTKGGVGKTLVATNLAVALADLGRSVCIVDLDIAGGDVALMMQLTPQRTLADLSRIGDDVDDSGVQSLLTDHSQGLSVLAAPVQLGAQVPAEPVGAVLDTLRASFDIVVVDTSGAFDDYSLQALDHTDLLLLVGTLDIPALKSLKLAVGTLDLLNFPRERRQLLLNRNDTKVGLSSDEFETTLGLTISASLASSRDVLTSVNRGEPIVRAQRSHQASKALAAFAVRLVSDLAVASRAMPTDTPSEADSAAPRRGARRGLRLRKVS